MNSFYPKTLSGGLAAFVLLALLTGFSSSIPLPTTITATFTKLDLYANIETVGVVVTGTNLPETAQLMYRQSGEVTWHTGHPLARIGNNRLVGSLFGLSPAPSSLEPTIEPLPSSLDDEE